MAVVTEQWERWATFGAVAFVGLIVVAVALTIDTPSGDANPEEWVSFYDDSGNRSKFITGGFIVFLAGALFLWWLGALRSVLGRIQPGGAPLAALVIYGGLVGLVLQLAGTAAGSAYPGAVEFFDDFGGDGQLAMLFASLSFWVSTMANVGGTVMAGALAAIVLRTGLFPRWFGWVSVVVAATQLAGAVVPFVGLLFLPWVLTLALLMLRRPVPAGASVD
jgi:hypothetical protein